MDNPCKKCDRKGCGSFHDECPKYKAWVDSRETAAARRNAEIDVVGYVISTRVRMRGKKK